MLKRNFLSFWEGVAYVSEKFKSEYLKGMLQ